MSDDRYLAYRKLFHKSSKDSITSLLEDYKSVCGTEIVVECLLEVKTNNMQYSLGEAIEHTRKLLDERFKLR